MVQRPLLATVSFDSPFELQLPRPLALKPRDRKPPELGPKVRVEAVRLSPAADDPGLAAMANGTGLRDWDGDGFKEHGTASSAMWKGDWKSDMSLEFELPEAVPVGAVEVWNYNAAWQTTNGLRKADVEVSPDGTTWQTVFRAAEFGEADGREDYDEPALLQFKGAMARKIRFSHLVPWGNSGKVGLGEVVFHQAAGPLAGPRIPEDGAAMVALSKPVLEWVPGQGAIDHRVYFGTSADKLELLGSAREARLAAPLLKPDMTCFWRVDEVQADGRVVQGRVARFDTAGLVAWWKLDDTGAVAEDASGHKLAGRIQGRAHWVPGRFGGALEFDGRRTYIDCGGGPEFEFRDGLTVSAWIKVGKFLNPWANIVSKGDTAWRLQRERETGTVTFSFNTGNQVENGGQNLVWMVSKTNVEDNQWHHLVGVVDGSRASLYVDGKLEGSAEAQPIARNDYPVYIGENAMWHGRQFNGLIDDVRVYGYGLKFEQVQALYDHSGTERASR